jgi:hypothetical protein
MIGLILASGSISAWLAGAAFGWLWVPKSKIRAAERATEEVASLLQPELTKAVGQMAHLRAQWEMSERKASEYLDRIRGIIEERDKWERLYHEQSIGHGNAQAVMMGYIGHLERQLMQHGVEAKAPAVIQEIHDLYIERHVSPALNAAANTPPAPVATIEGT